MKRTEARILREYGPFPGVDTVAGVAFDGSHLWFASGDRLSALDPEAGEITGTLAVAGDAGTAFDGRHLWQIAEAEIRKIDPATGAVLATIPAPAGGGDSGLAWAEGALWVGDYRGRRIHQVDPESGAVLRTIGSGVSGLESDGADRLFCGGGDAGRIRVVRRPGPAATPPPRPRG